MKYIDELEQEIYKQDLEILKICFRLQKQNESEEVFKWWKKLIRLFQ